MPIGGPRSRFEEVETASQADTDPLPFDHVNEEEEEEDILEVGDLMMDAEKMRGELDDLDGARVRELDAQDVDMKDANGQNVERSLTGHESEQGDEEDADAAGSQEEMVDNDELLASQATGVNTLSPSKHDQGATNFSDESDLTDEPDDDEEGEDDEDDIDGDVEEDGDAEDDEELDEDDEADEDEAAEGLAALTGGQSSSNDLEGSGTDTATGGLDGLAVIAAAAEAEGEDESSQAEEDTDNDSIAGSHSRRKARKVQSAIPRRTTTRLNEMMVASPAMSEDDADEEEEEDEEEDDLLRASPRKTNREMSSLIGLSSAAKRSSKPGAAGGLLAGAPSITIEGAMSAVPSTATSRAGSVKPDEEEEEEDGLAIADNLDDENAKGEEEGADGEEAATPARELDEIGPEEEPSTDEAALRRQEAMEALTKIEIGFAHLRDKLYIERMNEVSKEGEMILEGTHPDLIHLSNLIEIRREKKLKLVEKWFEQQEKQYERVAMTEEAAAWNNWRNEVVELRRQEIFNAARKRRKLDREKRILDIPRPARRHQIFETELVRNPEYDRKLQRHQQMAKSKGRMRQEGDEMAAFVAFPDLRSADEAEAWMDMERMGLTSGDPRLLHGMGPPGPFYRPEEASIDPYAMYAIEQQQQQQIQQQSGSGPSVTIPSSTLATYGPPQPSDFAPYERPYDARAGHTGQGPHGFGMDAYGRPLSPPPQQQQGQSSTVGTPAFTNTGSHRGGPRGPEPYTAVDHTAPHTKGTRRTPPPAASAIAQGEREVKGVNAASRGVGGGIYSPPLPTAPRPGEVSGSASRGAPSQYAKYDDGPYRPMRSHASNARPPSQGNIVSTNIRPKAENLQGMESGSAYNNHRHQDHLYSR